MKRLYPALHTAGGLCELHLHAFHGMEAISIQNILGEGEQSYLVTSVPVCVSGTQRLRDQDIHLQRSYVAYSSLLQDGSPIYPNFPSPKVAYDQR